ncbi:Dip2/Utp12 family-domain-containing protein [Delphinella strobiligena]|nr:Dip2/Utp12 family-domain-containing protein [Delphinella strobiligena]
MSAAKRSRGRPSEAGATPSLPPNKKAKTSNDSHVPSPGLSFLTDENKRSGKKLSANLTNGVKDSKADRVDETRTVVGNHEADVAPPSKDVVDISSGEESSEYESSEDEEEKDTASKQLTNGAIEGDAEAGAEDVAMAEAENDDDETGPSFGDLLQASHPDTIDVAAAFADRNADAQSLVPVNGNRVLTAPSATSLGTVLTQALRTNDKDLLESCFQTRETQSIRSTIQRLQSPLVADLLQRLAERLYKRPGRAGNLMVWVQWSLVAHGGYLAGQPQVLKKLKALSQVVKERASGLQSLMTLKGKLDMLGAQLELRQAMQETRGGMFDEDDEDPNVIYIEGEEDESSDDETAIPRNQLKLAGKRAGLDVDSDDEDIEGLPMTNGVADHSGDESDDDDDVEGLIDDEAEVTSDEEGEDSDDDEDEDEIASEDDVDESASEDDAPAPVRPPKPQRSSGRKR